MRRTTFDNYTEVADYCRKTSPRISGRVMILIKNAATAKKMDVPFGQPATIEACSVKASPANEPKAVIKTRPRTTPKN